MRRLVPLLAFILLFACTPFARAPTPASPTSVLAPLTAPAASATAGPQNDFPDGHAMNLRLGRGVNLGNALEAPDEGEWGVTLQEGYFDRIAAAGFDSVRLPVRWSAHADKAAPYALEPDFLARVDQVVGWALERGLAVVLDCHHCASPTSGLQDGMDRFLAIWDQLGVHYADYPPELVFEILNEPDDSVGSGAWNGIAAQALAVIRRANPRRAVVIGGVEWNGLDRLPDLDLPPGDRYLIATFHYYLPFEFTHQGVDWVDGMDSYLGTGWDATPSERQAIQEDFDRAAEWARQNDRPLYLGEFGSYERADLAARIRWTAFVRLQAEEHGFAWAYWEFCSNFGIYDPVSDQWRQPLLQSLLP